MHTYMCKPLRIAHGNINITENTIIIKIVEVGTLFTVSQFTLTDPGGAPLPSNDRRPMNVSFIVLNANAPVNILPDRGGGRRAYTGL